MWWRAGFFWSFALTFPVWGNFGFHCASHDWHPLGKQFHRTMQHSRLRRSGIDTATPILHMLLSPAFTFHQFPNFRKQEEGQTKNVQPLFYLSQRSRWHPMTKSPCTMLWNSTDASCGIKLMDQSAPATTETGDICPDTLPTMLSISLPRVVSGH